MTRFKNLIAVFAFSLLVLALPTIASAQWRDRDRDNDDYNRNGRYNRNLESTIKNLKNRSKDFARKLDRELDRSRYDDRNREDPGCLRAGPAEFLFEREHEDAPGVERAERQVHQDAARDRQPAIGHGVVCGFILCPLTIS